MELFIESLTSSPRLINEVLDDFGVNSKESTCHHSGRRGVPRGRDRGFALKEMSEMSEVQFKRMFRLSRMAFNHLLDLISPIVSASPLPWQPHTHIITNTTKLATTLRWLAGGSYLDICFAWYIICYGVIVRIDKVTSCFRIRGISTSSFYKDGGILWTTIDAINQVLHIGFPISDEGKLDILSKDFSVYSHGRLEGCVMAIDGLVVKTRCPTIIESPNQTCFRNRKGMWGIVILAGCDSRCRFMMWVCKYPGSTNDAFAWDNCELKSMIVDKKLLSSKYYVIGDEGIPVSEQVLIPFSGRNLNTWLDSFNYHLSSMRQCIERAFGILTRRWGVLWRPLICDMSRWHLVTLVCAKLHNLCIDIDNYDVGNHINTSQEDADDGDDDVVILNYDPLEQNDGESSYSFEDLPENTSLASTTRLHLTNRLKNIGCRRPPSHPTYKV